MMCGKLKLDIKDLLDSLSFIKKHYRACPSLIFPILQNEGFH